MKDTRTIIIVFFIGLVGCNSIKPASKWAQKNIVTEEFKESYILSKLDNEWAKMETFPVPATETKYTKKVHDKIAIQTFLINNSEGYRKEILDNNLTFKSNESELSQIGKASINTEIVNKIKASTQDFQRDFKNQYKLIFSIEIFGYADGIGSSHVNKRISKERALNCKKYIEETKLDTIQGIKKILIYSKGCGSKIPVHLLDKTDLKQEDKRRRVCVIRVAMTTDFK